MPKIPCRIKHSNCQAAWLLQSTWYEATWLEYTAIKPIIRIIYIMEPTFKPRCASECTSNPCPTKFVISSSYVTKLKIEIKIERVMSGANSHPIESRLNIRREFAFKPREIEITMKIGEYRALGPQFGDPVEGFRQGKMTGVARIA